MFFYVLLACFLVSIQAATTTTPSWTDCGGPDSIIKVHDLILDNVIEIGNTKPIRLSMNATQTADLSGESRVSVKIRKNYKILGQQLQIPVPCINGIGTCEMSLCEYYTSFRKLVCTVVEATNHECGCPTEPGEYAAKDVEYTINLGIFPSAILAIGNGDYSMDMVITDNNKELGCLKVNVAVKFV